jgi:N-acetylneuraminic acid mutarotase
MGWPRQDPTAVLLGDGRVLVLGDTGGKYEAVPEHSRFADLWDPETGSWHATDALPKARGSFAAVTLKDGRALVAGGVNDTWYSYSSAYVFDPATEQWTKVGLMGTARTHPAAAVLPDGRVLVTGGMYYTGVKETDGTSGDAVLAGFRLADTWPGPEGHALAIAELFDPATGTWTPTGSMRYTRSMPSAVSLADGRVLVAGGIWAPLDGRPRESESEVYDPATGRFSTTEALPEAVDPSLFDELGVPASDRCEQAHVVDVGRLAALADGDAILLDSYWDCRASLEADGRYADLGLTRTFRFAPATGRWTETGLTTVQASREWADDETRTQEWGGAHPNGIVVPLSDGQLLVAGGSGYESVGIRTAELFDPAAGTWSRVPDMPEPRVRAASVVLADGSALIIGGYSNGNDGYPIPLGDAFRFVPGT